jgi:hypothetical protein
MVFAKSFRFRERFREKFQFSRKYFMFWKPSSKNYIFSNDFKVTSTSVSDLDRNSVFPRSGSSFRMENFCENFRELKNFVKTFSKMQTIAKTFAKSRIFATTFGKTKIFATFRQLFSRKAKNLFAGHPNKALA